jgi:putative hydrolase of the HAD superfamily
VLVTRPRAVVFDFGDTLMREGPFDVRAGAARVLQLARDANGCTTDRLAEAMTALAADLNPRRQASQLEPPTHTIWRLIYEPFGIRFDQTPTEVEWAFWSAATVWTLEPGAPEIVELIARSGVPCGVLSNTMFRSETIARQLEASGFRNAFRWVMASADFVFRKPHRRLFDLATQRMGEEPGRIWFVGDSFENDVCGAAAAGMVPVWYRVGDAAEPRPGTAAYIVRDWAELGGLFRSAVEAGQKG